MMPDNPFDSAVAKDASNPFDMAKPKPDVLKSGPSYGMDDDHILQAAGYTDSQIKQIKSSSSYKPGAFASMMTNPDSMVTKLRNAKLGPQDYVLGALGQPTSGQLVQAGLSAVGTPFSAALQNANHLLGAVGIRKPEDVLLSDAVRRVRELDFKQNAIPGAYRNEQGNTPLATKAVDLVGQAVPYLAVGAEGKAAEGTALLPKVVQSVKTGAKLGALAGALQPVEDPQADFWRAKALQTGTGAAGGALLGGVAPVVSEKIINPFVNKASAALTKTLPADAQAIQDLGDKFGVRTLAPDLTKSPVLNKTAVLMESVPGSGTVATRQAQQAEAQAAAQKLVDQYGIQGDTTQAIQSGLANKLASAKAAASAAYDRVAALAQGKGEVPLNKTLQAIQQFKGREASAVVPDSGLVNLLDKMEKRIAGSPEGATDHLGTVGSGGRPVIIRNGDLLKPTPLDPLAHPGGPPVVIRGGVSTPEIQDVYGTVTQPGSNIPASVERGPATTPQTQPPAPSFSRGPAPAETPGKIDLSYTGVRGLRSDLGNMISDYYKGTNTATGSKGVQVLQGVKNALEDDLSTFTSKNGPELASAAKQADSLYKNGVVPFKDQLIAKAVKTSEPDQIYGTMIQLGKGDRAQKFYNALDSNGQAAVRSQMVQNAMDAATVQDGVFSPAKFAQSLEKINDATGVFFKGRDKMELDGFTNLMRHIQRAGQIGENPPTGARAINALIAGEGIGAGAGLMTGHPAAAAPLVASSFTARVLNTLFQSPRGKALLLAASDSKPGSAGMQKILEKLSTTIGAEASASGTVIPFKNIPQLPAAADQPNQPQTAQVNP